MGDLPDEDDENQHDRPRRRSWHRTLIRTTARRVGLTFVAMLALFAIAILVALQAAGRMARADEEDARMDRAKDAGHRVASLVREQYIHQAHTIIEWNRSHLDHYQEVAKRTRLSTEDLTRLATNDARDATLVATIVDLVRKNHDDFMLVTLPAIDRGDHEEVIKLHQEMEKVVGQVTRSIRELNERFEARSALAHTTAERERARLQRTMLICFGVATLLGALVVIVVTRRIGSRLSALHRGARRIGDGDLQHRISLSDDSQDDADGGDELAELSRSLNTMASRLERHQRERIQSQKLESIGRLCAGVAHEINGPLGIILGYASVIRKDGLDEEALSAIEDEARQCQRIVQALLDMSRQGEPAPRFEVVDLAQLARDGVERLRALVTVGERKIIITPSSSKTSCVLAYGDEAKLRQVLLNLLKNAVEGTDNGGTIEVAATMRGNQAVLSVNDDGPGLPAAAREHMFEPFFTTKDSGTGLGLAITRAIVDAHRGEIRFVSPPAGGTRVEVSLESVKDRAAGEPPSRLGPPSPAHALGVPSPT